MARRLAYGTTIAENEFDFREVCRALRVNDDISRELAQATARNVEKRMRDEGVDGRLDQYYNTYRQGMDATLNAFLTHTTLQPIAHLFRLKSNIRIASGGKRTVSEYCTFTMLKSHFAYYQKHGVAPKVANNGRIGKHAGAKKTYVQFPGGGGVKLPQNETWERFKAGIAAYNQSSGSTYTLPDMILMILEQFMADKKDLFGSKTSTIDESRIRKQGGKLLHLKIDAELSARLNAMIQRYNAVNTPKTNQTECVNKAIAQFLDRLPLVYTDPKAYAEELALKRSD